jgi:hypothetical protein
MRAAKQIERNSSFVESTAELIDREKARENWQKILESLLGEACDLIEARSPELVARARAALRRVVIKPLDKRGTARAMFS